jgi:hypothetical protein
MFEGGASRPRRDGGRRFCTKIPKRLRARHLGKAFLQVGWRLKATSTVMWGHAARWLLIYHLFGVLLKYRFLA